MERFVDFVYLIYFGTHIPITFLFDSQVILPSWLYPDKLQEVVESYAHSFDDSLMRDQPAWFLAFTFCEVFLQFPFFFVALFVYWKGVSKYRWIRVPVIVYATNVVTSMLCIYAHMFFDTTTSTIVKAIYMPYLIVPLILLLDALFHPVYTEELTLFGNPRAMKKGV